MRLIDAKTAYWKLVDAGQHSKRYKLNEMWELNGDELEETLDEVETIDAIPISFIEEILHRDICLVYRGCLLMLLEKWREENESIRNI